MLLTKQPLKWTEFIGVDPYPCKQCSGRSIGYLCTESVDGYHQDVTLCAKCAEDDPGVQICKLANLVGA